MNVRAAEAKGTHAGNPPPLTLTTREWRRSSDIFSMEYADILERHKVLHGQLDMNVTVDPEHLRLQLEHEAMGTLLQLRRGALAAVVMEMAEQGESTRELPPAATEAQVRAALRWNDTGWPWQAYGPVVMAAVRAGVPVLGANLPRARMKDAMEDVSLDAQLSPVALKAQQEAVRSGHCNALPESQIAPMTRIQIARDRAMAQTLIQAKSPGKVVVLVSGAGHSPRVVGVPQHLPTDMEVRVVRLVAGEAPSADKGPAVYDATWLTPALAPKDYCAEFKATRPPAGR